MLKNVKIATRTSIMITIILLVGFLGLWSGIAESTNAQNEKLQQINARLGEISQSVEVTAAMAEQSAAASIELDDQINSLRDNVNVYQV